MTRIWESALSHASRGRNLDIWFYIDDDDIVSLVRLNELQENYGESIKGHVGQRIIMTEMTNVLARECSSDIMFLAGDDIVFNTYGWDDVIRETFAEWPDKIGWVFGHDGYHEPGSFGTHGAVHRNWLNVLGHIVTPIYSADYADTHLCEITKNLGRFKYVPLDIEHLHYVVGKSTIDETMREKIQRGNQEQTGQIFINALPIRIAETEKLLNFMNSVNGTQTKLSYQRFYP